MVRRLAERVGVADGEVFDSVPHDEGPGAAQLARGKTATWWYTVSGILMYEVVLLIAWSPVLLRDFSPSAAPVLAVSGVLWIAVTLKLLSNYRRRFDEEQDPWWLRIGVPFAATIIVSVVWLILTQNWLLALLPVAQSLALISWPSGVRARVIGLSTVVLIVVLILNRETYLFEQRSFLPVMFTVLVPLATVSSLWWWDVLVALDRARAFESRLAATQERLRVANDVHDLQGHHLQVIALQLELAERLLQKEPEAALRQIQAARGSVGEAQQGTRDLARQFRTVPLHDELANSQDLLVAAGLTVEAEIAADANLAPAEALGPVIREATTNVLRHGGGQHVRIYFGRDGGFWIYQISNDIGPDGSPTLSGGVGLESIRERVSRAAGTIQIDRGHVDGASGGQREDGSGSSDFRVIVKIPDSEGEGQ